MNQQDQKQATVRRARRNARHRLLRAASDLLWEKSYHSVTVDEVCTRADAGKGSLYYFFESKSALVVAALQHRWDTTAEPAYQKHFSHSIPPLERITSFLKWHQCLQRERHCTAGHVLGWPFFSLGCELGAGEPAIRAELCAVESAELGYFESAIRDAMADNAIEPGDSHAQALSLRAAMEGILARARILDELDELNALSALPTILLHRNPPENGYDAGDAPDGQSIHIPHSPCLADNK
jgi:TetR/AcrR family transcriptional repressor of nem operon